MSHNHGHISTATAASGRALAWAVGLTLAFVASEAVAGMFAHSLWLISDAGHNLADAAALGLSWYAMWIARKPANPSMTYGYHRVGILAALVNAMSLVAIAVFIVWEGVERIGHPGSVQGWLMIIVAAAAVALNVTIGVWLHAGSHHNLNVHSAYIHMIGDALSAFGVVIAGIIIVLTGAHLADPIVSFLIAALILWSSWGILKQSVNVLLEGTPEQIDMKAVEDAIRDVPEVLGCHDLHVWTVGPGAIACSVHIMVAEQTIREGEQILRAVAHRLDHDFRINHTTVQVEVEGHGADEMYCCIEPSHTHTHTHAH